jgi:glycosyltransferase involved in cell wall biosynthesis
LKVLLTGTSLRPAYGGPAHSVSRLAHALAQLDMEVGLWAPDRSAIATELLPVGSPVRRLAGSVADAVTSFGRMDILHDNGMWLPHNHALAEAARRAGALRVVSTRGMLEPWAVRHKRWKKAIAWQAYQRRDLRQAGLHHATAAAEAENLRRLHLGVPVCMIPNGVDVPAEVVKRRPLRERTALFLGRLYPVKGLPMLVEAWARVRPRRWRLEIGGPDEAGHRAQVEQAIARLGLGEVVSFLGPLDGAAKREAFCRADLLVLPSHSESFGMVVGEALAHGAPVLATTAVPWPLLELHACGWRVEPSTEALADGLRQAIDTDAVTLRAMGARGRELVAAEFGWDRVARRFYDAYLGTQAQAAA